MTKTTKIILGIIVIIIIIGGIWYGVSRKPAEEEVIRIGIVGHFSGEYASYSIPMKNAVELAVEEINENGGINNKKIELIVEDDGAEADKAASAMNKLVNIDKVSYIISAQGSGATSVVAPIAQNNRRILMITLASAPGLSKTGEYIFRSVPSDVYQAVKMVDFINNVLKSEKVAGLYVNDAYGVGIKDTINENIEIVANEMFEAGAADFRTNLLKIKEKNADTLVLVARKNEFPIILKQIEELNMNMRIVASETFNDEEVLKDSGSSAEGVVTFMANPQDYISFNERYEEKFNEKPSAYSMYAYDGAMALLEVIKNVGDNIEAVKNELFKINFNGASGRVSFDKEGDRIGIEYIVYIVKNGQFVLYEE